MRAKNIMTSEVFTVSPEATVREIATILAKKGISALPVVDLGEVVGIVSHGDLLHRQELGTDRDRTHMSWPGSIEEKDAAATFDAKEHGMRAGDIMTRNVISIPEDASLAEIVDALESNNIKRLLVMRGTKFVGVVSRSDIVRALAARPEGASAPVSRDDDEIRFKAIETLEDMPGTSPWLTTVIVSDGIVSLFGTVEDDAAYVPSRAAIEHIPCVVEVQDHRAVLQPY